MITKENGLCFFHTHGDFTPVCTTEFIAFSKANTYFEKLNTCLIGLSIDSTSSHLAWLYDIYLKTGIKVPFPVIADRNGEIARKYGMIANSISSTKTVRNVFIIDDKGIIRVILVYPLNVGRCVPEILRIIKALQIADCNNASTPANWRPKDPIIISSPNTFEGLLKRNKQIEENKNGMSWYLSFENAKECSNKIQNKEIKKIEGKK